MFFSIKVEFVDTNRSVHIMLEKRGLVCWVIFSTPKKKKKKKKQVLQARISGAPNKSVTLNP